MLGKLGKVSGVLVDLSGTLFIEKTPTPGAIAALERFMSLGGVMGHYSCCTLLQVKNGGLGG